MRISQTKQAQADSDRPESFQLKGGLFPMSLLDLKSEDLSLIKRELQSKVLQAPDFFKRSAVVLGFENLQDEAKDKIDIKDLIALCRELNLIPTAVRGITKRMEDVAHDLGLAVLPKNKNSRQNDSNGEPDTTSTVKPEAPASQTNSTSLPTKIVSSPIRSGQQIYARGGDLIVLSSVSAGAEVLADGNIHIYGALRGRALAGIQGDETARIFCSSQEAELVSIAGQFLVDEVLRNTHWKQSVQIFLENGRLTTALLTQ